MSARDMNEYVRAVVDAAPPLSLEQRDSIAAIHRRTLADMPAPDETTARRLLGILDPQRAPEVRPAVDVVSEPLEVRFPDE